MKRSRKGYDYEFTWDIPLTTFDHHLDKALSDICKYDWRWRFPPTKEPYMKLSFQNIDDLIAAKLSLNITEHQMRPPWWSHR